MTDEEKDISPSDFTGTSMQLPVQDEDKDKAKDPFYTSEDPTAGTHEGWIKDPDIAHVIANAEKTQGRDVALEVEENKRLEYETGLNEVERFDLEAVEKLVEIFPDAFEIAYNDRTGESCLVSGFGISAFKGNYELSAFLRNRRNIHFRETLPPERVALLDKFPPLLEKLRESGRLLTLLEGGNAGLYFSKRGIESFNYHREARDYDPNSIKSTTHFQDLSEKELDLLLEALSFIDEYAKAIKNETPKEDIHSIAHIETRAKEIKAKWKEEAQGGI